MKETEKIGGWDVPCAAFDYGKMAAEARREQEALKRCLDRVKAEKPKTAERELLRRREVRLLTDMYYEQRSNALFFAAREKAQTQA